MSEDQGGAKPSLEDEQAARAREFRDILIIRAAYREGLADAIMIMRRKRNERHFALERKEAKLFDEMVAALTEELAITEGPR